MILTCEIALRIYRGLFFQATIAAGLLFPLCYCAADLSEDARALGKDRRDAAITQAKQQVASLEKQRTAAARNHDAATVASLLHQIRTAKTELTKATKKTVEEYANEAVNADGINPEAPKPPQPPRPDPAAEQAAAAEEAERRKLSGDCPLKLTMVNFVHADAEAVKTGASANLFPSDLYGPKTIVICEVVNKSGQAVEAYEFDRGDDQPPLKLTASIGVAVFPAARVDTVEDLFSRADSALYRAKADGRNRVRQ